MQLFPGVSQVFRQRSSSLKWVWGRRRVPSVRRYSTPSRVLRNSGQWRQSKTWNLWWGSTCYGHGGSQARLPRCVLFFQCGRRRPCQNSLGRRWARRRLKPMSKHRHWGSWDSLWLVSCNITFGSTTRWWCPARHLRWLPFQPPQQLILILMPILVAVPLTQFGGGLSGLF